jgi:hypothetical protein
LLAEVAASALPRTAPSGAVFVGMFVRMLIPLGVCMPILATGQHGRVYLFFVGYLLTFYMVTLALETWIAVKRTGPPKDLD